MFTQVYSFAGPLLLCPRCAERRRLRHACVRWGLSLAGLVLIPFGIWADWLSAALWPLAALSGLQLAMYLSVLPHEFGHALMARAVGYHPLAVVWGGYPSIVDRQISGIRILVGIAPESGCVLFDPANDRWPRLKHGLIVAAGPLTNALLAAGAFTVVAAIPQSAEQSLLEIVMLVFAVANALLALGNLWPSKTASFTGHGPNDGALLLSYVFGKSPELARQRAAACQVRLYFASRDESYERVLREADTAEGFIGPAPWIEVARSASYCNLQQPARARELLRHALAMPQMDGDLGSRSLAENNFAWANFVLDDPADDADSLERSARAMAALPWLAPVVMTRACVLAARACAGSARLAEARDLLARAGDLEMTNASRQVSAVAHGLIAAAEGDFAEARRQLQAARAIDDPGLAGRVLAARLASR
jgi:hypothetical protein